METDLQHSIVDLTNVMTSYDSKVRLATCYIVGVWVPGKMTIQKTIYIYFSCICSNFLCEWFTIMTVVGRAGALTHVAQGPCAI